MGNRVRGDFEMLRSSKEYVSSVERSAPLDGPAVRKAHALICPKFAVDARSRSSAAIWNAILFLALRDDMRTVHLPRSVLRRWLGADTDEITAALDGLAATRILLGGQEHPLIADDWRQVGDGSHWRVNLPRAVRDVAKGDGAWAWVELQPLGSIRRRHVIDLFEHCCRLAHRSDFVPRQEVIDTRELIALAGLPKGTKPSRRSADGTLILDEIAHELGDRPGAGVRGTLSRLGDGRWRIAGERIKQWYEGEVRRIDPQQRRLIGWQLADDAKRCRPTLPALLRAQAVLEEEIQLSLDGVRLVGVWKMALLHALSGAQDDLAWQDGLGRDLLAHLDSNGPNAALMHLARSFKARWIGELSKATGGQQVAEIAAHRRKMEEKAGRPFSDDQPDDVPVEAPAPAPTPARPVVRSPFASIRRAMPPTPAPATEPDPVDADDQDDDVPVEPMSGEELREVIGHIGRKVDPSDVRINTSTGRMHIDGVDAVGFQIILDEGYLSLRGRSDIRPVAEADLGHGIMVWSGVDEATIRRVGGDGIMIMPPGEIVKLGRTGVDLGGVALERPRFTTRTGVLREIDAARSALNECSMAMDVRGAMAAEKRLDAALELIKSFPPPTGQVDPQDEDRRQADSDAFGDWLMSQMEDPRA